MRQRSTTFANVTASLALFVALGGTAVAAVTLPPDSVGSVEIRQDAVRAPEIERGAVRSSEIEDAGIKAVDVAPSARDDLLGEVRLAEPSEDFGDVASCPGTDLSVCPDHLRLRLSTSTAGPENRNWLVQAKLGVSTNAGSSFTANRCGLVDTSRSGPRSVLDELQFGKQDGAPAGTASLVAVIRKAAGDPTVALRCTEQAGDRSSATFVKLTALEVGAVSGP